MRIFPLPLIALALCLSACSSKKEIIKDQPIGKLYNMAYDKLVDEKYEKAANYFEEVDKQHPYSPWASKAQIMGAFSHYMDQKYVEAESGFETFLDLHPGHAHAPYAMYMIAICQYEQLAAVRRDQTAAGEAVKSFERLISRFPGTVYADEAHERIVLLSDHIAAKEMATGRFYQERQDYESAIPRFQAVVDTFSQTMQVREALYRLVACYLSLDLKEQAKRTAAVLGHNYPESHWYKEAYDLLRSRGVES